MRLSILWPDGDFIQVQGFVEQEKTRWLEKKILFKKKLTDAKSNVILSPTSAWLNEEPPPPPPVAVVRFFRAKTTRSKMKDSIYRNGSIWNEWFDLIMTLKFQNSIDDSILKTLRINN